MKHLRRGIGGPIATGVPRQKPGEKAPPWVSGTIEALASCVLPADLAKVIYDLGQ
jgi:hypothetical protein